MNSQFLKQKSALMGNLLASFLVGTLVATPAQADKPSWAGNPQGGGNYEQPGKGHGAEDTRHPGKTKSRDDKQDQGIAHQSREQVGNRKQPPAAVNNDRHGRPLPPRSHFREQQGTVARDYYHHEFERGHCPPGLAKKRNGCRPPGQAKKWRIGRPLPRGVIYYDLPPPLVVELGHPPPGYRYVRTGSDILLIAIGTGLVVDAITVFTR